MFDIFHEDKEAARSDQEDGQWLLWIFELDK